MIIHRIVLQKSILKYFEDIKKKKQKIKTNQFLIKKENMEESGKETLFII